MAKQGRLHNTERSLQALGCEVLPSMSNFLMFRPAPGTLDARALHGELLKKGIIIRSLKAYDLPEWLRVSMGTDEENELFLNYTKEILGA